MLRNARPSARTSVQKRRFGPLQREVSIIGQGTWYIEEGDPASAIAALRRGIDLGMNHIDTAEMYGAGAAEELVGHAIAGRRDEVFLVSQGRCLKMPPTWDEARLREIAHPPHIDRLDCYLLHWRGRPHPLEDTFAASLTPSVQRARYYGKVSNFDVPDLEEAQEIAGESSIVCNQVLYHLQERAIEHGVLPWCEQHRLAVTAHSPFGHGDFPSKHTPGGRLLADIAQAHDATTRQIALAFLTRRPSVFATPKASSVEHVEENAGASDIQLSQAEWIDAAFPRGQRRHGLPML